MEQRLDTAKKTLIRSIVAGVVILGLLAMIWGYIIFHDMYQFFNCLNYPLQDIRLYILIIILVVLIIIAAILRRMRILYSIATGLYILTGIIILLSLYCFAASSWNKKQIIDQGRESPGAAEDSLEVSSGKIRDVVAENIANLAELDNLRAQAAASAQVATVPAQTIINETIIQQGSDLSVACGQGEILIYDGQWVCATLQDAFDDNEIEIDQIETSISAPSGITSGNAIATYENENGDTFDINETVTTLVANADGSYTYTSENGTSVTIPAGIAQTITTFAIGAKPGEIVYTDENGTATTINIQNLETTTTTTDNTDGTVTYTNEDGIAVTVDSKDFVIDTGTIQYADGKISCLGDEQVLQWDDALGNWKCIDLTDTDTTNELNTTLTLTGTTLNITDAGGTLSQDLAAIDTNTLYTNGSGLSLSGTTFSVNAPTCTGTDKLQWNGTAFVCSPDIDTDTDTTLTEAEVDAFANNNGYLTSFTEVDGDVTNELNTGASLTGSTLTITDAGGDIDVDLSSLLDDTDTLASLTCAVGEVAKYNGSAWACAPDIDTDTTLTEAEVDAFANNNGYLTSFTEVDGSVTNEVITATGLTAANVLQITEAGVTHNVDLSSLASAYTSGNGLALASGVFSINAPACTAVQKLTWSGTAFACTADIDTDTDTDTTYTAGTGITLTGTTFSVNAPTCTGTDKLQWNGTAFVCSPDIDTDTTIADDQTLSFATATNILTIADGNTVDLSSLDHEQTYTVAAGVPAITGAEVGDWYEDSNTTLKYVWDGTQWKLLESTNSCYLGGATIKAAGTLGKSNGVISGVTRTAAGKYVVDLSETLVVDDYVIQVTAHDTDVGQINLSNAIIDVIAKGTDDFEVHINFGDNGNVEDEEGDSDFEVALFDLNCDPASGSSSGGTVTSVDTGDGLTGGPITATGTIDLDVATVGSTATTANNSGLEVAADGLSLLRGCADKQTLAWDATLEQWQCQDTGNIGSAFDVYDNTGGQAPAAAVITLNLDTVRHAHPNYTLGADVVRVNSDGLYEVTFDGAADTTANVRSTMAWWLEKDTGAGFVEEDGSRCFTYHRTTLDGEQSCSRTVILDLTSGDQLRVRLDSLDNSAGNTTIADGSSMSIKKFVESGADYAEVYYTNDEELLAGHIVSVDDQLSAGVQKIKTDAVPLGIVSTDPGQTIGAGDEWESGRPVPIALMGRVPVRVSDANGVIKVGDFIAASSIDGVGVKANQGGWTIGIALEDMVVNEDVQDTQDDQTVMVFISKQWYPGSETQQGSVKNTSDAIVTIEESASFGELIGDVWNVTKDLVVQTATIFENAVTFLGKVTFIDRVTFADTDAGGFAMIKKGAREVEVTFENSFVFEPIITVSSQDSFVPVIATEVSQEGFIIAVENPAKEDIRISWTALAVVDPDLSVSEGTEDDGEVEREGNIDDAKDQDVDEDKKAQEFSEKDDVVVDEVQGSSSDEAEEVQGAQSGEESGEKDQEKDSQSLSDFKDKNKDESEDEDLSAGKNR